jgi:hypothetical protein
MGRNIAKKKKKLPSTVSRYGVSLSGRMNCIMWKGFGRGGRRDLTVALATSIRARMRKPQTRIVQPNPILGISLLTMIGKMTPPVEEPAAMIPKAAARFLKNQVGITLIASLQVNIVYRGLA